MPRNSGQWSYLSVPTTVLDFLILILILIKTWSFRRPIQGGYLFSHFRIGLAITPPNRYSSCLFRTMLFRSVPTKIGCSFRR